MIKHLHKLRRLRRERGLSIIELLVALAVGGVVIAGAVYVYDQSRNTYVLNDNVARIQEQARFAMSLIESEVQMAGYYGFTNNTRGFGYQSGTTPFYSPNAEMGKTRQAFLTAQDTGTPSHACGRNYAIDLYHPVQGGNGAFTLGPAATAACAAQGGGYRVGTDTLTVRHADITALASLQTNKLQLIISRMGMMANFITTGVAAPSGTLTPQMYEIRDLVVRAFYISQNSEGFPGVPALRMKSLRALDTAGGAFSDDELAGGVEDMQIQFGVDTASYDGDDTPDHKIGGDNVPDTNGQVTRYLDPNANLISPENWNAAQIVAVRIWLRVRGDAPERDFIDNSTYSYAGVNYTPAGADRTFRRMLVSKTIQLRNARTL